jgi:DnaJ like chaperone protein
MPFLQIWTSLGLAEGGSVRSAIDALLERIGAVRTPADQQVAFTIAFVALAAKMAKADGIVALVEKATFERLHTVDPSQAANVQRVFALAAGDSVGFEHYARQIARLLADEPRLLRDVLDALFHIAAADGILHPDEQSFLLTVSQIFGVGAAEFRAIRAAFVTVPAGGAGDSPYEILGVDPTTPDADLKARHREMVRDHHPDSLTARGVPAEFHAAAGRKLAVINAAYDEILRARGLKTLATVDGRAG